MTPKAYNNEDQLPPLPKGVKLIDGGGELPPLPKGVTLVEKKNSGESSSTAAPVASPSKSEYPLLYPRQKGQLQANIKEDHQPIILATKAFESKQVTPQDIEALQNTEFGKSKGLDKLQTPEDKNIYANLYNSKTIEDINNDVRSILSKYPFDVNTPEGQKSTLQITDAFNTGNTESLANYRDAIVSNLEKKKVPGKVISDYGVHDLMVQAEKSKEIDNEINSVKEAFTNYIDYINTKKKLESATQPGTELLPAEVRSLGQENEKLNSGKNYYQQRQLLAGLANKQYLKGLEDIQNSNLSEGVKKKAEEDYNKNYIATENVEYDREKSGLGMIINSLELEYNDIQQKAMTSNPELTDQAAKLRDQIKYYSEKYNKLDDNPNYADVRVSKVARLIGDEYVKKYGSMIPITSNNVRNISKDIEKNNPGFMEKYGRDIDYLQQHNEMIPMGGFLGGVKAGLYELGKNVRTGFGYFGGTDQQQAVRDVADQYKTNIKGTGFTEPTRVVLDENGLVFKERPNEDYGKINWNNTSRFLGKSTPGLAEFILLDKGLGAAAKLINVVGVRGLIGLSEASAKAKGIEITAEELAAAREALSIGKNTQNSLGLFGALTVSGHEQNRKIADDLIDDDSSTGEAKKTILANLLNLSSFASFKLVGITPSAVIEKALQKAISKDALKLFEDNGWKITEGQSENFFKETVLPKLKYIAAATGQNVLQGVKLGTAMVLDENTRGLLGNIANPDKSNMPSLKDDATLMLNQVILMTAAGLPGMVHAGFTPTMKDAIYEAGTTSPQQIGRINKMVETGELSQEKANSIISMVKTMGEEVQNVQQLTNDKGRPLTVKQKRDIVAENFRKRVANELKQSDNNINSEQIVSESDKTIKDIISDDRFDKQDNSPLSKIINGETISPDIEAKLSESNDKWKKNIETIDNRTDITDAEKEKLKSEQDKIHAEEISSLSKQPDLTPEQVVVDAADKGNLEGIYGDMVKQDPSQAKAVILDLAKQKYGILEDGTEDPNGGRDISMKTSLDVDEAVTKVFPDKESVIKAIKEPTPTIQEPSGSSGVGKGAEQTPTALRDGEDFKIIDRPSLEKKINNIGEAPSLEQIQKNDVAKQKKEYDEKMAIVDMVKGMSEKEYQQYYNETNPDNLPSHPLGLRNTKNATVAQFEGEFKPTNYEAADAQKKHGERILDAIGSIDNVSESLTEKNQLTPEKQSALSNQRKKLEKQLNDLGIELYTPKKGTSLEVGKVKVVEADKSGSDNVVEVVRLGLVDKKTGQVIKEAEVITGEKSESLLSNQKTETPTALRDVESTAKALEGKDVVQYLRDKANSLRDKDGNIPKEKMDEWRALRQASGAVNDGLAQTPESAYQRTGKSKKLSNTEIAEAYHKAKEDGSNPELVKAVESLLSKEQAQPTTSNKEQGETKPIVQEPIIEEKVPVKKEGKLIGKKVTIAFAGGRVKGEVISENGDKIKVLGADGTKYSVSKKAILKEGQTLDDYYGTEAGKTQKVYEEIIGAKPNEETGRIPVAPIVGVTSPKRISDILFDVSKAIGKKINYNKPSRSRAIGTYSPASTVIKIRFAGDLDTTAHEIGHSIDDNFGILSDLKDTPNKIIEDELKPFSKHGSEPPAKHPNKRLYRLGEGFAEWLRAYIVNPDEAIKAAPEVYKLYESKVSDKYKEGLKHFSDDIRTWAAASGRDMILSNIEWKPDENKDGIISRIFKKSDNADMFEVSWADKVAANFTNPLQAFDKSVQYAAGLKGLDELLPKNDPTILARLLLSVDRKFGSFLETGLRDAEDNLISDKDGNVKTFNWLLEPLDNTDESTIKSEMEDTLAYMVAERTVELGNRFGRESILSGIGGGIFKDADVAKKALDEFTNGDADRLARIKEAADRYRSYSNDILDYMADKGRLVKEKLDDNGNLIGGVEFIKKNNLQYVALKRIMEASPNEEIDLFNIKNSSNRLGSKAEIIHTIKGSTRTIRNPYVSLLDTTYKGIKEADRNNVLRQYRDLLTQGRTMYEGTPVKFGEIGYIAKQGEANTISIYVDGKLENWKFNNDIYKGLKGLDSDGYKLPGVLTLHARVLRNFITKFPVFAARNWVRDLQDRIIKSDSGVKDLFGDKKHWEDVARNGGLNAGYYMRGIDHYYGLMEEAIKDLSKDKKTIFADPSKIKHVWQGYENFLQSSETANRVAEYRSAFRKGKERGMDDYNASLYASFRSRDLMDFALMGHYMKIVNQVIPFSNAAIQGIRSTAVRAAENPAAFLARIAAYTILPQVALWTWNHKTDEDAKEYEALPEYQRDMFWNFKIGENKWVSIPKPYELGLFASGTDRGLSKAFGYNKKAFSGYAGSVFQTVSPFDLGSLSAPAQPIIEANANKSFYTGKHIIPQNEDALDLSLRHTENASRLGQIIQKTSGIDARKIDYIIKNQFGYTGRFALGVSDIGKKDSRYQIGLHDLGFFNQSPAYNSQPVQDMVKFAEQYGLKQSKEYAQFNNIAGKYFDAKTDAEKDDIAKQLVETANYIMNKWEKLNVAGKKTDKFSKNKK